MLLTVEFPHERFNTLVRSGEAGQLLGRIIEEIKPEAVYFTEDNGRRCGVFVINVQHPGEVPRFAEPFFLNFEADCKFRIAMRPEELKEAGLEELGKKWGRME
jgi:hypothetical protein